MTNVESVKDKVRALLAKAMDPAASEHEASGAMAAARKLMAKFDLSEEELMKAKGEDFKEFSWEVRKTSKGDVALHPVDRRCSVLLCKFCGVVPYVYDGKVHLFGLENDVELAKWMLHSLRGQFDKDWEIYKRFELGSRRLVNVKEARISFSAGFAKAINERMKNWIYRETQSPETGTSLVVKKNELVAEEMRKRGLRLGAKGKAPVGINAAAAGAGYNSGKAAETGRGVGGSYVAIGR